MLAKKHLPRKTRLLFVVTALIVPLWASAKPPELIDAVNSLTPVPPSETPSVTSPASVFYTLVMLEHVAYGSTKKFIEEITKSSSWKRKMRVSQSSSSTVGWVKMDNIWWVSDWREQSERIKAICRHFRTELRPAALTEVSRSDPWKNFPTATRPSHFEGSLLWTEAEFSPRITGGLSPVPSSVMHSVGHAQRPPEDVRFVQTQIIDIGVGEGTLGSYELRVPLESSGELIIRKGETTSSVVPVTTPVILFLPELELTGYIRPMEMYGWSKIGGLESEYGNSGIDRIELSDWVVKSTLSIRSHRPNGSVSQPPPPSEKKKPRIIILAPPFSFEVRGSHGERLFEGKSLKTKSSTQP